MTQTREGLIEAMALAIKRKVVGRETAELATDGPWREWELNIGRAALAAIEEHAAVVPREPTRAMCIHGEMRAVDYDCKPADDVALEAMGMIYRAMLSASPYAPEMSDE